MLPGLPDGDMHLSTSLPLRPLLKPDKNAFNKVIWQLIRRTTGWKCMWSATLLPLLPPRAYASHVRDWRMRVRPRKTSINGTPSEILDRSTCGAPPSPRSAWPDGCSHTFSSFGSAYFQCGGGQLAHLPHSGSPPTPYPSCPLMNSGMIIEQHSLRQKCP